MSKKFKSSGNYEKQVVPEDEHLARIVSIIDLGTQVNTWKGEEKLQSQVKVQFELVEYSRTWVNKDGEEVEGNAMLSKTYTQTMSPQGNFVKLAKAALGRKLTAEEEEEFDPDQLLGLPVVLEVLINDNGNNKIGEVMRVPKGEEVPEAETKPYSFWLDEDADWEVYEGMYDWLKDVIAKSPEYAQLRDTEEDDDIPTSKKKVHKELDLD